MHAAASGKSTLGIPKSVGQEFADADEGGQLPERAPKASKARKRRAKRSRGSKSNFDFMSRKDY